MSSTSAPAPARAAGKVVFCNRLDDLLRSDTATACALKPTKPPRRAAAAGPS